MANKPSYIELYVGNEETQGILLHWMNRGELGFRSDLAPQIVEVVYRLVQKLECTLIANALPEDFFTDASLTGNRGQDAIYLTASRMNNTVSEQIWTKWGKNWTDKMRIK